jgi:hypothetical protein
MTLREEQPVVQRMLHQSPACVHQPLLQTRQQSVSLRNHPGIFEHVKMRLPNPSEEIPRFDRVA